MKRRQRFSQEKIMKWFVAAVPALLASMCLQAATLTNIVHAPTPGGGLQLQLQADSNLTPGKAFMINDPPRLVVDLAATDSALAQRTQAINAGPAQSVSVVPAEGRTRVVVNLTQPVRWSVNTSGKTVFVTLDAPVASKIETGSVSGAPAGARAISDIDFRRGEQGEGRVIVDLSSPDVQIDTRPQGGRVVVDFKGATLPPNLSRKLDRSSVSLSCDSSVFLTTAIVKI